MRKKSPPSRTVITLRLRSLQWYQNHFLNVGLTNIEKKCMFTGISWEYEVLGLTHYPQSLKRLWSSLFMAIAHRAIAMNGVRDPYVVRMPNGLSLSLAFNINSHAHCISRTVKYSNWWGLQFIFINIHIF